MAKKSFRAAWRNIRITFGADQVRAGCEGDEWRRHDTELAGELMRYALEREARSQGLDPADPEVEASIVAALRGIELVD